MSILQRRHQWFCTDGAKENKEIHREEAIFIVDSISQKHKGRRDVKRCLQTYLFIRHRVLHMSHKDRVCSLFCPLNHREDGHVHPNTAHHSKGFRETLRVARGMTFCRIHQYDTVVEPPYSPRELSDDIIDDAGRECDNPTIQNGSEDFEEDMQQNQVDQRSELEPGYFDGDASITIAKDEDGNRRFALLLTARIARDQNQVALAEAKRKAKQEFVKKLEDSISELEAMSGKPSRAGGIASHLGPNEQTKQSHTISRLQRLTDHKCLLEKEIRAQDLSIAFGN